MNEKFRSKQTNFERTLICNEKFTIFNKENNLSVRIEKDKNKIGFRTATQKAPRGNFLDTVTTQNSDIFVRSKKVSLFLGNVTISRNVTFLGSEGFRIYVIDSSIRIGVFV